MARCPIEVRLADQRADNAPRSLREWLAYLERACLDSSSIRFDDRVRSVVRVQVVDRRCEAGEHLLLGLDEGCSGSKDMRVWAARGGVCSQHTAIAGLAYEVRVFDA